MSDPARILGFAFANADLLFEVDLRGTIKFAAGAGTAILHRDPQSFVDKSAETLFDEPSGRYFQSKLQRLAPGQRTRPLDLKLPDGTDARVAMFRLPQNGERVSCTLTHVETRQASPKAERDPVTGLLTADSFLAGIAAASDNDALTLIDLPGLPDIRAKIGDVETAKLVHQIGVAIAAGGAKSAARISESGFGVIADGTKSGLSARIRKTLADNGAGSLSISETLMSLKGQGLTPDQRFLAVRHVLDQFVRGEARGSLPDVAAAFQQMMDETESRLRSLTATVAEGSFEFAYQPIKRIKDQSISHFEALARIPRKRTLETVKFAEALGIADAFDLSVAQKILSMLETNPDKSVCVAFNISGATISSQASFGLLAGLLSRKREIAPRLLVEITETAQIEDLTEGNRAVEWLRNMGFRVGLDDFGAGAASLNYLHKLVVDFVKFDISLVKGLGQSTRDDKLLGGLVKLCGELGIETVAEGVESETILGRVREAGFDLAQGSHVGPPRTVLQPTVAAPPSPVGKRKGLRESWG